MERPVATQTGPGEAERWPLQILTGTAIGAPVKWALHGKTALITGGTRCIRCAVAEELAALGSRPPCTRGPGRRQSLGSTSRRVRQGPGGSATSPCGTSGTTCSVRSPTTSVASLTSLQYVQQLSVAEMRMLRWFCGHTRRDKEGIESGTKRQDRGGTYRGEVDSTSVEMVWTCTTETSRGAGA
ncbi:hypothetical protein GQ55_9G528400 [Panicum hallii var. hallii]|uniref:Uncharacterized protein n=1 Tax=Panicum hallii var. hallii TaxID=1504633 RepID=A0A2T7CER6_9POAL|nr:hypothetical protein GQ55_9G528400 [Panicum hallii var. hallii]